MEPRHLNKYLARARHDRTDAGWQLESRFNIMQAVSGIVDG